MTREEFVAKIRKLSELIDHDEVIYEAMAEAFDVHRSTVRRWQSGAACPLPRVRELVVKEMEELLEEE